MQRVHRPILPGRAQAYLNRKAQATVGMPNVERTWKSVRNTKTLTTVVEILQAMMGPRQRCMYCVDSHGSDIEHFWPKASYRIVLFRGKTCFCAVPNADDSKATVFLYRTPVFPCW